MRLDLSIATYQRPENLQRLIRSILDGDRTGHTVRVLVVDNDPAGSAREVLEAFTSAEPSVEFVYTVETEPGIPAARNRGIDLVDPDADAVIFVDDDEWVSTEWLQALAEAAERNNADIVAGPVVSLLPDGVPDWMHRGEFFQRKRFPSGPYAGLAATNNALVTVELLARAGRPRFDSRFTRSGGSDTDLFHRLAAWSPHVVWADEAVVFEDIPPERAEVRWLWRRYLRSGNVAARVVGNSRSALAVEGSLRIGHGTLLGVRSLITRRVVHVRAMEGVARGTGALLAAAGVEVTEYDRPPEAADLADAVPTRPERSTAVVSVVVPVHNGRSTLRDQLKALAGQNYRGPVEVVVVDNGSTDGLTAGFEQITAGLALDVRLVDASNRRGVSHARNTGVAAASGDLILICDADDEVHEDWISDLVDAAATADLVGGSVTVEKLNSAPAQQWRPLPRAGTLPGKLNFLPFARGCNIAVWRDVVESVGGWDEELVAGGDDADFSWRVQLAGYRLVAAERALVHYRLRPDIRGMATQVYRYSRSDAPLLQRYRHLGARASGVPRLVRDIGWIIVASPKVVDIGWRGKIVARAAQLAGRVAGSVRHRIWAL
ncbi:glycosyltransferase [Nakamurella silvestris]|nr:glycosyltransferase [Nakamurella silvestris]